MDLHNNILFGDSIETAPDNIGTPLEDAMYAPGPQERIDSCAIRAQQHILSMYGMDISESELVRDAISHNEYSINDTNGTSLDDVGNLLERNGLETHRYEGATMAHLISELGQGHKIIVGVDAYEIIADTFADRILEMQKDVMAEIPNHALVVVNVDPYTFEVDVVDPADGQLHRVSAEKFVDAWEDSNCFMVSTIKSPEEYASSIAVALDKEPQGDIHNGDVFIKNMGMRSIDINGDGIADLVEQDMNGDGRIEHLTVDINYDGISDVIIQSNPGLVNIPAIPNLGGCGHVSGIMTNGAEPDLGGIGHVGTAASSESFSIAQIDFNGDGTIDALGYSMDMNGDGIPDAIGVDFDGDGMIDKIINIDAL